jgi:hypothetical protein
METMPLGEWFCPICDWFISTFRIQRALVGSEDDEDTNWDNYTLL